MWSWITGVLGLATGAVDDTVRRWVGALISGVFGFIHNIFGLVGGAWIDMFKAAAWLWGSAGRFAYATWLKFYHILKVVIPDVVRWADKFIHNVWTYAIDVFHWTIHALDVLRHDIAHWLDLLRQWVVHDIWNPIWRTLAPAWKWITHEGYALWNLVTHPALLVDWIWNHLLLKIEREAFIAGKLLGRFFLSLILHNLRAFLVLIEDIIDSVL